jgi:spore cortex biosynthesis protein YabQ
MNPDLKTFLLSIALGGVLMLLWDLLHGLRKVFFHSVKANFFLDTLWWLASAASIVMCTWLSNSMNLRFFVYFGLAGGAFLYFITLSRFVRSLFCTIFNIIFKIIRFILKILLTPAVFLYKILIVPFLKKLTVFFRKAGNYAAIKKKHFRFCKKT